MHSLPDGGAVVHDVEIRTLEIHDALALGILYVGVGDAPFLRHRPVEHGCPGRKLVALDRDVLREHVDGPADSVAGDAPAYRKDLGCEGVNILSDGLILDRWSQGCNFTQSNHPPLPRPGM